MDCFYRGLSLFHMARKTRKRHFVRHGKKCLARIRRWSEGGCPNVAHFEHLLQAELAAYKGNKFHARNEFEASCVLAARNGFIQDAAFANERYGEFLFEEMDDKASAVAIMRESIKLYDEWGAKAKVEQVLCKYGSLWSVTPAELTHEVRGES